MYTPRRSPAIRLVNGPEMCDEEAQMVTPNDAPGGKPRIRIQEHVTSADGTRAPVLRARVVGRLGPYLTYRYVLLIFVMLTGWGLTVNVALREDGGGPLLLGGLSLLFTVIVALIGYELVFGQPVRAVPNTLHAMSGRVAVADLDRFEISVDKDMADLRAVCRDGRRVDVALGIDPGDARELVSLIESVIGSPRARRAAAERSGRI